MSEELERGVTFTTESSILPEVTNVAETTIAEELEESLVDEIFVDDLNKKNYVKITPTFYIKSVESEKLNADGEKIELFQILNPETQFVETRELSDDEKHEILVHQLKESHIRFKPIKHKGNITTNQFGADYRKKRQRKNKMAKASRKANR
jgi:hypothetical protein